MYLWSIIEELAIIFEGFQIMLIGNRILVWYY